MAIKLLLVGGTGTISSGVVQQGLKRGFEIYVLNRHNPKRLGELPSCVKQIVSDYTDEAATIAALGDLHVDCVIDFIGKKAEDIDRAYRIWQGRTDQYIFISSASTYQKPVQNPWITEETPLENPYWQYSQNKIACEKRLREYIAQGFPGVIVRPSLTYNDHNLVCTFGCKLGSWSILKRIKDGRPMPVPGDGHSIWFITHALDFGLGITGLVGNPKTIGEAFHITNDNMLNWNLIYKCIANAWGREDAVLKHVTSDRMIEYDPSLRGILLGDHACSVIFDNSKIKRFVPDFKAEIPFSEGAKRLVKWYCEHPEFQVEDPEWNARMDALCAL